MLVFFTIAASHNSFHIRWVYEGVIDDPYGEFFIAENKSLQKVPLYFYKFFDLIILVSASH